MKTLGTTAVRQLQSMYQEFTGGRKGDAPSGDVSQYLDDPDIYVAKTPSSGIPGRNGAALGNAVCTLYRPELDETSTSGDDRNLVAMVDHDSYAITKVVHNISELDVLGDAFIIIGKTKNGAWMILVESC